MMLQIQLRSHTYTIFYNIFTEKQLVYIVIIFYNFDQINAALVSRSVCVCVCVCVCVRERDVLPCSNRVFCVMMLRDRRVADTL